MLSRRRSPIASGLAVFGALLLAGVAFAATVQRLDFAGLTQLSTHVVTGRVLSSRPAWTADGGAVVTLHELQVASVWKGEHAAPTLVVRTPGGRLPDFAMEMPGAPELEVGGTVLLFLEQNPDGTYGVISLAQGSWRVEAAADGSLFVTRDPGAAHLVAPEVGMLTPLGTHVQGFAEVREAVRVALDAERAGLPLEPQEHAVPLHDVVEGGGR